MIEETTIYKQVCAAILFTQGRNRHITHIMDATIALHSCYPRGTRYFIIRSESAQRHEWIDSVYWLNGRCVVVSEKEMWRTNRASVIEGLLEPKEGL